MSSYFHLVEQPTIKQKQNYATNFEHLILVCGHYEGTDERINKYVDELVSVGDYVLTGGEIGATIISDWSFVFLME